MILEILLGLSIVNLLLNVWLHFRLTKQQISVDEQTSSVSSENQMSQIENDLNSRLRTLQIAQFSPRMNRSNIRLVRNKDGDS